MLQKKESSLRPSLHREILSLLQSNKLASAKLKVETLIQADMAMEVMAVLEVCAELLVARGRLLDVVEPRERVRGRDWGAWDARQKEKREREKRREEVLAQKMKREVEGEMAAKENGEEQENGKKDEEAEAEAEAKKKEEEEKDQELEDEEEDEEDQDEYTPLDTASATLLYASLRLPHNIPELTTLRTLLTERWGKEFAARAQDNIGGFMVPEKVVRGLKVGVVKSVVVDGYLRTIAQAYGVEWPPGSWRKKQQEEKENKSNGDGGSGAGGGDAALKKDETTAALPGEKASASKTTPSSAPASTSTTAAVTAPPTKPAHIDDDLAKRFAALGKR